MERPWDVVIIGGGVCGCSLLYRLARYRLRVLLLEKTNDVGVAATKANSAILHAGYDPEPGSLMAKYNVRGNELSLQICEELDILVRKTGSLVVAFSEEERCQVEELYRRGQQNSVPGLRVVAGEELQKMEPNLAKNAVCALYAPTAAVVNPWELAYAQAEVAVQNGAAVWLDAEVTKAVKNEDGFTLGVRQKRWPEAPFGKRGEENDGKQGWKNREKERDIEVKARFVVNAAGAGAAAVAAFFGEKRFAIHTNRGQYFLLDKSQGGLVRHVVFPCPTEKGKGVLVAPTVHGNLIVGPNSETAGTTATTAEGMQFVRVSAQKSVPGINFSQSIRNFAGLRAQADTGDFVVGESSDVPGLFHMAGIKSPGLTAATAMAEDMAGMLARAGLPMEKKEKFDNDRKIKRFNHMDETQRAAAIQQDALYGRIVCRCESVTEGEVEDALRRPLPPRSLDAVKRRCGPGMGRCQSGFCGPRVQALLAAAWGLPQWEIPQDGTGMAVVTGRTKDNCEETPKEGGGKVARHG